MAKKKSLKERFDMFEDEFLRFERIASPVHRRRDLCGFLMLAELDPKSKHPMVEAAGHEEIWMLIDFKKVAKASDEVLRDLIRCGVRLDEDRQMLAMFT